MTDGVATVPREAGGGLDAAGAGRRVWLRRGAVLLAAGLAALPYAWALGADPLEPYHATWAGPSPAATPRTISSPLTAGESQCGL